MKTFKICTTDASNRLTTISACAPSISMLLLQCIAQYPGHLDIAIFDCQQAQFVAHKPSYDGWVISATQTLKHSER